MRYPLYVLVLSLMLLFCGCGMKVVQVKPTLPPEGSSKSPLSITLIDDKTHIDQDRVLIAKFEAADSEFNSVAAVLRSNYRTVDVAPHPINSNPLYATVVIRTHGLSDIASWDSKNTYIGTDAEVTVYKTETKQKVSTYRVTKETKLEKPPSARAATLATVFTLGFALKALESSTVDFVLPKYNENLTDLFAALNEEIAAGRMNSVDDIEDKLAMHAPQLADSHRFYAVEDAVRRESQTKSAKCEQDHPFKVGDVTKRTRCLNDAWRDYVVSADLYVNSVKSTRLELAKKFDAGLIDKNAYLAGEREAMNTLLARYPIYEKGTSNEPVVVHLADQTNTADTQRQSSQLGSTVINGIEAILGVAVKMALVAAPIALGYSMGANATANSLNAYYNRPRVLTCTGAGRGFATCF
jgi:hypothetical protein